MNPFPLSRSSILAICFGLLPLTVVAQTQAPPQNPQAITVLQQSVTAMGTTVPSDSTANGNITTVAGSLTESGTITILTRGTNQTSEQIQTPHSSTVVYSQGQASSVIGTTPTALTMERAVTSQSSFFPLALLAGALSDANTAYRYVGLETLNGTSVHHIQFWNSFASTPTLQSIAQFSIRDIWIDSQSGLPVEIFYSRRDAGGSAPSFAMEVFFSNYRTVNGILYPYSIQASFNGTPWATITIQNVALNTGLTDSNFPIQ